jgi:hypothetical protein
MELPTVKVAIQRAGIHTLQRESGHARMASGTPKILFATHLPVMEAIVWKTAETKRKFIPRNGKKLK